MPAEFRDHDVAALEVVRARLWPELVEDFQRFQMRDRGDPEYTDSDWDDLQRSVFDAIALAVLDVRGVPIGDATRSGPSPFAGLPRPVPLDRATRLARERYWRAASTSFHVVWSRDVGRDGYDERDWQGFEDRIVATIAAAIVATSGGTAPLP